MLDARQLRSLIKVFAAIGWTEAQVLEWLEENSGKTNREIIAAAQIVRAKPRRLLVLSPAAEAAAQSLRMDRAARATLDSFPGQAHGQPMPLASEPEPAAGWRKETYLEFMHRENRPPRPGEQGAWVPALDAGPALEALDAQQAARVAKGLACSQPINAAMSQQAAATRRKIITARTTGNHAARTGGR